MKIEDPRVTHYALGELPADAREEFEKELALSDELQRELQDTAIVCEMLIALPPTERCRFRPAGRARASSGG